MLYQIFGTLKIEVWNLFRICFLLFENFEYLFYQLAISNLVIVSLRKKL